MKQLLDKFLSDDVLKAYLEDKNNYPSKLSQKRLISRQCETFSEVSYLNKMLCKINSVCGNRNQVKLRFLKKDWIKYTTYAFIAPKCSLFRIRLMFDLN